MFAMSVINDYAVFDLAVLAQLRLESLDDAIRVYVPLIVFMSVKMEARNNNWVIFVEKKMQSALESYAKRRLNLRPVIQM